MPTMACSTSRLGKFESRSTHWGEFWQRLWQRPWLESEVLTLLHILANRRRVLGNEN